MNFGLLLGLVLRCLSSSVVVLDRVNEWDGWTNLLVWIGLLNYGLRGLEPKDSGQGTRGTGPTHLLRSSRRAQEKETEVQDGHLEIRKLGMKSHDWESVERLITLKMKAVGIKNNGRNENGGIT